MTSTGIALVLLIAQLVYPSFAQQDTLKQTSPEGGLCLGDVVIYSCMVHASHQLVWRYTESNESPLSHPFVFNDAVNDKVLLGPLELQLTFTEQVGPSTGNIISTATFASGLTADEEGAVITCTGTNDSPDVTISFAIPTITNVSYCMSTIYWSPPPCDANCTVSVDGQDIGTVPCESRNLKTDDSNLSGKTVMIIAIDAIGRNRSVTTMLNSEDCSGFVEMSTTKVPTITIVSSAGDDMKSTESPVDSGTQGGAVAGIVVGVLFAVAVLILAIIAIAAMIYCYQHRKKGTGMPAQSITMNDLPEEVPKDAYKSVAVNFEHVCNNVHEHPITHCAISPDVEYCATADTSMAIRLWNVKQSVYNAALEQTLLDLDEIIKEMKEEKHANPKSKELRIIYGKRKVLLSLNWAKPQKESKLMLTYNNCVILYGTLRRTAHLLYEMKGLDLGGLWRDSFPSILCTTCSPLQSTFALSFTQNIKTPLLLGEVWFEKIDEAHKREVKTLCEQEAAVISMSFSPSGKKLVTGNINGSIRVYTNVPDLFGSAYSEWKAHRSKVYEVQFGSSDEEKVYSLGDDRMFYLWATSTTSAPLKMMHFDNYQYPPQLTWKEEYLKFTTQISHPAASKKKLFGFFSGYKYLLISSVEGKAVYEIDSNFDLAEVDLKLPEGLITCLDCMTVNFDNVKETDEQYTICVVGSTDSTVRFVIVKYGYIQLTESANQDDEGPDDHHQLPTAGEHARTAAENRMFDEMNNDRTTPPLESGLLPVEEDDQGQ